MGGRLLTLVIDIIEKKPLSLNVFYKIRGQTREEKDEINYFQSPIQKEKYGIGKTKQTQLVTENK